MHFIQGIKLQVTLQVERIGIQIQLMHGILHKHDEMTGLVVNGDLEHV
jgi:hypothetical protein